MNNTNANQTAGKINIVRDFLTGGHGIFTVSNPSGEHYTYTVSRPKDFNENYPIYFVGVLAGPNNTDDYKYLGIIKGAGELRTTANSKFTEDSQAFKVGKWAVKVVWDGKSIPEGYAIQHSGNCGRCGRTLTHPESLETGIGPVCAGR